VTLAREQRLEALYRRHAAAVHAYALRRVDRATADEVVAETFVVAWRRLEDVPSEPLPWLYGVARRLVANQTRGANRRSALAARLAAQLPATDSSPVTERTLGALEALGDRDREVLLLLAWEGLSQREAAEVLGCSHAAVRVRLHRARRRLRGIVDETSSAPLSGGMEVSCDDRA
jgi:RNA polymerase sigma-70 factor, ECF subfamily